MADYNLVVLVGRLTRDPELKYTPNGGTPFTKLGMAINHTSNMPDGSYQKSVTFVDISVWQHQAEIVVAKRIVAQQIADVAHADLLQP